MRARCHLSTLTASFVFMNFKPFCGRATWGPVAENKAPHGLVCVEVVGMGHVTAEVAVLRACHVPDSTSWAPGSLLEASFIHVSSVLCPWRDPGCPVARTRMLRPRAPVSAETSGACFLHQRASLKPQAPQRTSVLTGCVVVKALGPGARSGSRNRADLGTTHPAQPLALVVAPASPA